MKDANEPMDFERVLGELEGLVEKLEHGDIGLEESLRLFERGIGLTRRCQAALSDAEQKVEQLLGEGEEARIEPFHPES